MGHVLSHELTNIIISQVMMCVASKSNNRDRESWSHHSHYHMLVKYHLLNIIDVVLVTVVSVTLLGVPMCRHSGHIRT